MCHRKRHLLHDVWKWYILREDRDAEGSEDACSNGNQAWSPLDGSYVAGCDGADVLQEEVAAQYSDDVHCHHDEREGSDGYLFWLHSEGNHQECAETLCQQENQQCQYDGSKLAKNQNIIIQISRM